MTMAEIGESAMRTPAEDLATGSGMSLWEVQNLERRALGLDPDAYVARWEKRIEGCDEPIEFALELTFLGGQHSEIVHSYAAGLRFLGAYLLKLAESS